MITDDLGFLATAARMVRTGMALHVVILDFSGLDHREDPILRRTLLDALLTEGAPAGAAVPEFFRLAHDQLAILIEESRLADRRAALQRVAESLETAGRGGLKAHWFVLPRDGELLLKSAAQRAADIPATGAESSAQEGQLGRFLAIERSLHGVDLSPMIRQRPVWNLADPDNPQPVFLETTVALDELDRRFGTDLVDQPWLFGRVTALLDRRMLSYLLHNRESPALPLAAKLHADTVLDPTFSHMVRSLPASRHGRLIIELDWPEWHHDPAQIVQSIALVRLHELGVALDHVPMQALDMTDLPEVDWYRIPWKPGQADFFANAARRLAKVGAERCVLTRCTRSEAIDLGRAAGFSHFQGGAADPPALTPGGTPPPTGAASVREEPMMPSPDQESGDPEQRKSGRLQGWVGRLLRPRAEPAPEQDPS